MIWKRVAQSYLEAFLRARANCVESPHMGFDVQACARDAEQRVANA